MPDYDQPESEWRLRFEETSAVASQSIPRHSSCLRFGITAFDIAVYFGLVARPAADRPRADIEPYSIYRVAEV